MKETILVIEDNAVMRTSIVDFLDIEGYKVIVAENGGAGLGILQLYHPDLIICDINMPDFDGYQILRHVRKNETLAKTPFLFLTALVDRKSMRLGMDLGADDYITKPFTNEELLSAVQSRLQRHLTLIKFNSEELERAKKQLTQLVAHELRTPLSSIVMIEQLISRKIDALSKEQVQDLLNSWKSGAHRLHHLVEQMVLLTQLDSGVLTPQYVKDDGKPNDIGAVVEMAVGIARQFAYRHPHGTVQLEAGDETFYVQAISQALRHAFAEIISNALDFSPQDTVIVLKLSKHDEQVKVTITDTGGGLTTRRLERALMPFEQIDRHKQEQQGMGLGLPITKKIIEVHGGGIIFQKVASGGTRVIIELPILGNRQFRT